MDKIIESSIIDSSPDQYVKERGCLGNISIKQNKQTNRWGSPWLRLCKIIELSNKIIDSSIKKE
ncbi:MAG: hypothetical protein KHX69_05500 [Clostridium sp.]|nr:hypothetical protein [Clostridium sp.]